VAAAFEVAATKRYLLQRANTTGLAGASKLSRTCMVAIASAMRRLNVGEPSPISRLVDVDTVSDWRAKLLGVTKDARYDSRRDVDYVIHQATTVGIAGCIACQESKPLLLGNWSCRNSSIEAQQIGDWASVVWTASWANRGVVLNQWEQVSARCNRNWQTSNRAK